MPVTAKDVHVALRVDDGNVTIAGRRFRSADQTEFVLVVCSRVVIEVAELLSLLHLLVVLVEAVIRVLDDERVHHGHGRGCAKAVPLGITMAVASRLALLFIG